MSISSYFYSCVASNQGTSEDTLWRVVLLVVVVVVGDDCLLTSKPLNHSSTIVLHI